MDDEKKYPQIEEEDGSCLSVNEPALAYPTESMVETGDIDNNLGYHDFGLPHTVEEVKAELRDAEAAWDVPLQWSTSEEMWADIKKTFPWANIR